MMRRKTPSAERRCAAWNYHQFFEQVLLTANIIAAITELSRFCLSVYGW